MSPEQVRGKSADRRADIWAFGVVLFEMLTGGKVFHREDVSLTLASVMTEEPDWEELPKDTPFRIRRLLERCLEKDPRQRLQHIGEARIAIEDYRDHPEAEEPDQIVSPSTAISGRQKLLLGVAFLVVLLLGVLLSWMLKPVPPTPGPMRLNVDVSGKETLGIREGNCAALSPDGKLLVYRTSVVADRLRLRSLDRLTSEVLPGTETAVDPFFSPDGRWIGFTTVFSNELKKVSVVGGTPLTLCSVPRDNNAPDFRLNAGGTWGPNGMIVFGVPGSSLMKVSADGGTPEKLTELEDGELGHAWPQFLPGGKQVLFSSFRSETSRIEAVDLESKRRTVVLDTGGEYPRYAASGHLLYVNNGTLFAASFDTERLQTTSEPLPVLEDVLMDDSGTGAAQYGVSENGTLFYLTGEVGSGYNLTWVDAEGTQTPATRMLPNYAGYYDLSPEGRRLAVGITSNRNVDVWVIDLERESQLRLTFDEAVDQHPIWSPDGRFVYFSSSRDGKSGVYRKASEGSGEAERIWENETLVVAREASDKYLVLSLEFDLHLLSLLDEDSAVPEPYLANLSYEVGSPRISPNGNWLAYDSNETGRWEVYVGSLPRAGGRWQVSSEGGFRPKWSADGKRLFYRTDDAIWGSEVETQDDSLQISKPERLAELEGWYDQGLGVDSAGDRFLLISEGGQGAGRNHVTFVFNWFEELRQLMENRQ
jgi:serine/threonine-protein kinase